VICVDDCSTDDTVAWLEAEQQKHPNLRVIKHTENKRQGGGRNTAVAVANGEYIMFIDQDDYYHPNSITEVYEFIKDKDLDVFVSDSAFQFKSHPHNNLQLNLKHRECMTGIEFFKANGFIGAPWRMCIKREFYLKHNLQFVEHVQIEDVDWAVKVIYYAEKMQYAPILLIHYNKAEDGQTDNIYKNINIMRANTIAGNRVLELAHTLYKDSEIRGGIENVADTYYNFSCKYMLGLCASYSKKLELIRLIDAETGHNRWVRMAKGSPRLYTIASMATVPLFRLLRKVHRYRTAREHAKRAHAQ
jgi:glycosyltransferase involved in cell wall biosynthesis